MPIAVSVVVVVYNIPREAPRTLFSLSAAYQRHIEPDDYEIIVVDNGSSPQVDPAIFQGLAGNFQLIRMDPPFPSPAPAINCGLRAASGELIGVMIDGARMVTPGLLHFARAGAALYPRAVVATLGWYLGYDIQRTSIETGYDQTREDALLRSIDWPQDGYRLFEIATLDESSTDGWFSLINESNALFLKRDFWEALGGFDEMFTAPGGGLVNLDTFRRALEFPNSELILLLGEASFHQLHGGIATNASPEQLTSRLIGWLDQYAELRGRPFDIPRKQPTYLGTLPQSALVRLIGSLTHPCKPGSPLGPHFDRDLCALEPPGRPENPLAAALTDLAHAEVRAGRYEATAALARIARRHFPDEPEPARLLSLFGPALVERLPPNRTAEFHTALGQAYALLGDADRSRAEFETAVSLGPIGPAAHMGVTTWNMPGEHYVDWLSHFHELLSPSHYVEIGVYEGTSICRALPPTRAIGVDPCPVLKMPLKTETYIFTETSNEFFARQRLKPLIGDAPLSLAFIDGDHSFGQALLDFINLEQFCGPQSVILLHDTCPLNEASQAAGGSATFYTGDVWRVVLCLRHFRPDLDIFTIATRWSGLTVITGLSPTRSRIMADRYEFMVKTVNEVSYGSVKNELPAILNMVANDGPAVRGRLRSRLALGAARE